MNRRQVSFLLASATFLGLLSGCGCQRNYRAASAAPPPPAPACDRWAATGPMPPRFTPPGAVVPGANPPAVVTPPPGGGIQQNGFFSPGSPAPTPPSTNAPGVYLQQPEPAAPEAMRPMQGDAEPARPAVPQTTEPPAAPQRRDDSGSSPDLPVSIPRFAIVKANIASGQEPFSDGIDWLAKHRYRAVLHIRTPGEDDSAARKQFEKSGLRYLSLEVSPQTLSRATLDEFNRVVMDANNLPLFVYDKDSSLAGGLWYLHFRLVEKKSDQKAREEAEHLGFTQSEQGAQKSMWIAVQNLLKDLKAQE